MRIKSRGILILLILALMLTSVNVALASEDPAPVLKKYKSIAFTKSGMTVSPIKVGAKFTLKTSPSQSSLIANGTLDEYEPIEWSVYKPSVATIDADTGVITPVAKYTGTTYVYAKGTLSGKRARGTLVVRGYKLKGMKLNASSIRLDPRKPFTFKVSYSPSNATYKSTEAKLDWIVKPEDVPQDQLSKIERQGDGTYLFRPGVVGEKLILTVTDITTQRKTICKISVEDVPVSSVKTKKPSATVYVNNAYDLGKYIVVSPSTAGNQKIKWSSSKETVATVDENGLVTMKDSGTVRIYARAEENNGQKFASTLLTCKAKRVTSIALNYTNLTMDANESASISSTIKPSNASFQAITWENSNPSVAEFDANSNTVIAKTPGKTVITAITDNGRKKVNMNVRVRGGTMQTVSVNAVGDIILGGDPRMQSKIRKDKVDSLDGKSSYKRFMDLLKENGASYFMGEVTGYLKDADVTVFNLEGTITSRGQSQRKDKRYDFKITRANALPILADSGLEVANLANNHTLDFGPGGYTDTRNALKAAGIKYYGNGTTTSKTVNGVKIGFAGFNIPVSRSSVNRDIRKLKKSGCDIVIASFHWAHSLQGSSKVYAAEKSLSRYAINAGATMVLGHHKHVLSGLELYKGRMIVYDLGNFLGVVVPFDKYRYAMIYRQYFNVFDDGFVEVSKFNILPVMNSATSEESATNTGRVHVANAEQATMIKEQMKLRTPDEDLKRRIDNSAWN
ncbi:CapA family protein [Eubacteriales bacterium OttesenSCG-928-N13]|nr:CapA family protein [Eubacteriales bacterium OttesenSCG-928-N13]